MSYASVQSRASSGMSAPAVTVEVHLANGLPSFTLVGLADTEVRESRERVRAALQNSGLDFPANRRITVSLAPADLPKVTTPSLVAILLKLVAKFELNAKCDFDLQNPAVLLYKVNWSSLHRIRKERIHNQNGCELCSVEGVRGRLRQKAS
jgi:hypothetical protein